MMWIASVLIHDFRQYSWTMLLYKCDQFIHAVQFLHILHELATANSYFGFSPHRTEYIIMSDILIDL